MQWITRAAQIACAASLGLTLTGCTLPRSGPTASEILSVEAAQEAGLNIINVTPAVAEATRFSERFGFGSEFTTAGTVSPDTINAGDTISITVWEAVDTGLLAGVGQKATAVDQMQVDGGGQVYMPYVGRIRAAGRTPDDIRNEITESLSVQTPDPQVEVRRIAGDGASVSVLGDVRAPGVYAIDPPTNRLSAMLAKSGGIAIPPDVAQVKLERRGSTGRVWLQDLYDNPNYDVALRGGDRIIVEQDRRAFTALGASTSQARVAFTKRNMSAMEAIASSGGLDGRSADPTGIFVFRTEKPEILNRLLGRSDLTGGQRVAYILNLTDANGVFAAREFNIRDEDTVYITEAPFAAWSRVMSVATSAVSLGGSVAALSN